MTGRVLRRVVAASLLALIVSVGAVAASGTLDTNTSAARDDSPSLAETPERAVAGTLAPRIQTNRAAPLRRSVIDSLLDTDERSGAPALRRGDILRTGPPDWRLAHSSPTGTRAPPRAR